VRLDHPFNLPRKCLRLEAAEYGGTVSVNIVPCTIFGRQAVILRTDKNDAGEDVHSRKVVEVATDVSLRDHYGLNDGDIVTIEVGKLS